MRNMLAELTLLYGNCGIKPGGNQEIKKEEIRRAIRRKLGDKSGEKSGGNQDINQEISQEEISR